MKLVTITPPSEEPITSTEAKSHARISGSADDTYLGVLITAARELLEERLGRYIMTRTVDAGFDEIPTSMELELPRAAPLVSVTSITTYSAADVGTVWSSSEYQVDTMNEPGQIVLRPDYEWPDDSGLRNANKMVVRYVAGWSAANVPQQLKAAAKEIVAGLYDRDDEAVEAAVKLAASYRVWHL